MFSVDSMIRRVMDPLLFTIASMEQRMLAWATFQRTSLKMHQRIIGQETSPSITPGLIKDIQAEERSQARDQMQPTSTELISTIELDFLPTINSRLGFKDRTSSIS